MYRSEKALTIVEIMIVLVIIGVMTATFGKKLFGAGDKMKAEIARTQMQQLKSYIEQFQLRYNVLPNSIDDLVSCNELTGQGCVPIANTEELLDPWGTKFSFAKQGTNKYQIKSLGADRAAGGDGVDYDTSLEGP